MGGGGGDPRKSDYPLIRRWVFRWRGGLCEEDTEERAGWVYVPAEARPPPGRACTDRAPSSLTHGGR